jgi:hypothetical protein
MEFLTTNAESPSSDDEANTDANTNPITADREAAIEYLCHRLSLPRIQTLLVTYLLYHTARYPRVSCDIEDLSNMMRVHPLRMMQMNNDLAQLEDLGYIVRNYDVSSGHGWTMSREAYDAFMKNQSFDPQSIILTSNLDFLERASQYIDEGVRYDSNGLIAENITRLMKRNHHLPLETQCTVSADKCRRVRPLSRPLPLHRRDSLSLRRQHQRPRQKVVRLQPHGDDNNRTPQKNIKLCTCFASDFNN